jgi:hypothetical protein
MRILRLRADTLSVAGAGVALGTPGTLAHNPSGRLVKAATREES